MLNKSDIINVSEKCSCSAAVIHCVTCRLLNNVSVAYSKLEITDPYSLKLHVLAAHLLAYSDVCMKRQENIIDLLWGFFSNWLKLHSGPAVVMMSPHVTSIMVADETLRGVSMLMLACYKKSQRDVFLYLPPSPTAFFSFAFPTASLCLKGMTAH